MHAAPYGIDCYNVSRRNAREIDVKAIALDQPRRFFLRFDQAHFERLRDQFAHVLHRKRRIGDEQLRRRCNDRDRRERFIRIVRQVFEEAAVYRERGI